MNTRERLVKAPRTGGTRKVVIPFISTFTTDDRTCVADRSYRANTAWPGTCKRLVCSTRTGFTKVPICIRLKANHTRQRCGLTVDNEIFVARDAQRFSVQSDRPWASALVYPNIQHLSLIDSIRSRTANNHQFGRGFI